MKFGSNLPLCATGIGSVVLVAALFLGGCSSDSSNLATRDKVALGRAVFNDTSLSQPRGQSCATCHQPSVAFVDPRQDTPTSEGAINGRFGNRQAPTIKYMAFSPKFHFDEGEKDFIGGQFWDGRAVDLKDQVHFPMLAAAEMNNPNKAAIVAKVAASSFANSFKLIYGAKIFDDPDKAFDAIADAIAAFESSAEFNPFSSKYDFFLKGQATLTDAETRGLALFKGKAKCANCHPSDPGPAGEPPLFTDFTYDNIGLPKNPNNLFFTMPALINPQGAAFIDIGLQKTTNRPEDAGRMKVPTLRNIAITAPYFHNGVIATLDQAVQFYNKRDVGGFGPPELPDTMNRDELGNLGLTDAEVQDIVAFLKTLTDGYVP